MSAIYFSSIWFDYIRNIKTKKCFWFTSKCNMKFIISAYSDSNTSACRGIFCDNMFPIFLFWTLKFEHQPSYKGRVDTIHLWKTLWRKVYFHCICIVSMLWYSLKFFPVYLFLIYFFLNFFLMLNIHFNINVVRCAIWYQTLKNGVLKVGENAVLTS